MHTIKSLCLFLVLVCFQVSPSFAQSKTQKKINKKIEKAKKVFSSGKMTKGLEKMDKIIDEYPINRVVWDEAVQLYYKRYSFSNSIFVNVSEGDMDADTDIDSDLVNKVFDKIKEDHLDALIVKCRAATLIAKSQRASTYIRSLLIDAVPDSVISEEAQEEYDLAEKFFEEKKFRQAKEYYKKALEIEPNYYKATLYVGDAYFFLENMDSAIHYFRKATIMQPNLLEPRKYLVDALYYDEQYIEAKKETIAALALFPDEGMYIRLSNAVIKDEKDFDRQWIIRRAAINVLDLDQGRPSNLIWQEYHRAEGEIEPFCDENGIIVEENKFTDAKYLEVYAWEKMLKEAGNDIPEHLEFAKKMMDEGYLDCYVFFSLGHYDMYEQYIHFMKNNEEKVRKYVETYLIEK